MYRSLRVWLALAGLIALGPAAGLRPPVSAAPADAAVTAVESVAIVVADMQRSLRFFTGVLAFEPVSDVEMAGSEYERLYGVLPLRLRVVRLKLGDELVDLLDFLTPEGRPVPADSRSQDRWFQHIALIVSDMDAAYARLRAAGVRHVSPAPQRLPDWNPNAGGIEAFYFQDPDGHVLEILEFPPDKGLPKWQTRGERLFLGIDHTAIVVSDTEASLRFYRDGLGLRIAGASENHGIEQERLNAVSGARLRITALRAGGGPGIELLEYLAPGDGRPAPADTRASDLIAWQTRLLTRDAPAAIRRVLPWRPVLVSPGPVTVPHPDRGSVTSALLRDPDGHALVLVESLN